MRHAVPPARPGGVRRRAGLAKLANGTARPRDRGTARPRDRAATLPPGRAAARARGCSACGLRGPGRPRPGRPSPGPPRPRGQRAACGGRGRTLSAARRMGARAVAAAAVTAIPAATTVMAAAGENSCSRNPARSEPSGITPQAICKATLLVRPSSSLGVIRIRYVWTETFQDGPTKPPQSSWKSRLRRSGVTPSRPGDASAEVPMRPR